jgi:hypothetical protein
MVVRIDDVVSPLISGQNGNSDPSLDNQELGWSKVGPRKKTKKQNR